MLTLTQTEITHLMPRLCRAALCATLVAAACLATLQQALASTDPQKLQAMAEMLDRLEREDFLEGLEKVNSCTTQRNFTCSDAGLKRLKKLINGAADRKRWEMAANFRQAEEQRINEELRAERQARRDRQEAEQRADEERERVRRHREELAERRERDAANRAALASALGAVTAGAQTRDWLQAETQATLARTPQLIAQAQREKADEAAARQAAANRAAAERNAARREAEAAEVRRASANAAQMETQRQAEQERQAEQDRRAERARREREAKEEERRVAAERRAAAEAAQAARAKEKADLEAAKRAEAAAEARAKKDYLNKLISGTRMAARKCPDGEGKYYVVGVFPKISPELVSCKDVHFKATCPGDVVGVDGVGTNFLGAATDCFMGDTVKIAPLACPVAQVTVRVRDIRACGE